MSLPKLDLPYYKHHLVGLNKTIHYRPFTNKEQKILLLAKESKDPKEVLQAMLQILDLCIKESIDVEKLPSFDAEDIFLRIRSKSVSNESEIYYKVKDTGERISCKINLDDIKVQENENHSKNIPLTDSIGIKMRYPSITDFARSDDDLVLSCIECVYDDSEVYNFSEYTSEEQEEWLDSFDLKSTTKIREFFETMPSLKHKVNLKTKTGEEFTITLSGLEDFFI